MPGAEMRLEGIVEQPELMRLTRAKQRAALRNRLRKAAPESVVVKPLPARAAEVHLRLE